MAQDTYSMENIQEAWVLSFVTLVSSPDHTSLPMFQRDVTDFHF